MRLIELLLLGGLTACGGSEPAPDDALLVADETSRSSPGGARHEPARETDAALTSPAEGPTLTATTPASGDEGVPGDSTGASPTDASTPGVVFTHRTVQPGEGEHVSARLKMSLEATLGVGILASDVEYAVTEVVEVERRALTPIDGSPPRTRLHFTERTRTRTLPVTGKESEDKRVHGKTYLVDEHAAGPTVLREKDGVPKTARESHVEEVLTTWDVLGGTPPLFAVLADGTSLEPGEVRALGADQARRLLGVPFEELAVDELEIAFAGADPDGRARFDTTARLSGSADLGGATTLSARLTGPLVVDPSTTRVVSLELEGKVRIEREGDGMLSLDAEGKGPLKLTRRVSALPADH